MTLIQESSIMIEIYIGKEMSGTKKTYHLDSKNYFEFFNIEEKFDISGRSLATHFKKVSAILRAELREDHNNIMILDKLSFAERAFDTLLNPLERARYIIKLNGYDNDIHDTMNLEDFSLCNELRNELMQSTTEDDIEILQDTLKEQSDFIIQQLHNEIDTHKNYVSAASLVSTWYELRDIYEESKTRKSKMQDGITFVAF